MLQVQDDGVTDLDNEVKLPPTLSLDVLRKIEIRLVAAGFDADD